MINKVMQKTVLYETGEVFLATWVYDYVKGKFYVEYPDGQIVNIGRFGWYFLPTPEGVLARPVLDFNKYIYKKSK
jgi:hypothetical protein